MFLMNASPLVALQTTWESFAPARNCRYPICFSESEGDVARTSVSAKVQMIINNLQSQESPLGMNNEYDCIMQKKHKGEKGTINRVTSSTTLLRNHPHYTKRGCPADSDDAEVEENVGFGTLLLDSDSDDSVDRGIEEAIQEYLKAKSKSDQSLQRNAECSESISRDKRFKREFSKNKMTSNILPVKFSAEMLPEEYLSDHLGISKRLQPASPQSISSDDSFEQSIQAEIVQFLNEKKQQEISKCGIEEDEKDTHMKPVLKCNKETTNKTNCGAVKHSCNTLLLRQHPKLQKTSTQSKCLQSKIQEEPRDCSQVNQACLETAAASQPRLAEQNKESGANYWETREAVINENMHASDSSSDDGIEEAIQLYQLEKIRKEAGRATDGVPLQREPFDTKGMADISASLTISSTKSASPEIHKSPVSNKRKETNSKSTELESTSNEFNRLFKPLKKARHFAPPENKIAACELTLQASCRADTSAELMCAEAILDISKTIMPSQMGTDNKSLAADSFFSPQLLSSSRCESDSSLVDSDDSIEQEIRAFLALKAQSENLGTKPPSLSHSIQMPLPSDQNSLTSTLEPSLPKTLKLPLAHKRRLKREGRIAKQGAPKPPEQLETGLFQPGNCSKFPVLQEGCALSSPTELGDAQRLSSKDTRQQQQLVSSRSSGFEGRCPASDSVNPFMQVQSSMRKLMKNPQERDASDDESSSLDSDEDLDSAIKDLLRSKRKLKKKSKDQKSQCKKRVRFSEAETQLLGEFSSLQQSEWKCKNPVLLKSCLSKPRKAVKENAVRNPSDNTDVKLTREKPETMKNLEFNLQLKKGYKSNPVSNQNNLRVAKNRKCTFTAASDADDSSSVDSDDSIEQEIRKFLAEKAKDSASNSEIQKDDATLDLLSATKQAANKGKVKQYPAENEVDLMLSEKAEVPQQSDELKNSQRTEGESAMLRGSGKPASSADNVNLRTTGQSKAKQGVVGVKGAAGGEVSGNTTSKKDVPDTEPMQKMLPPKPSTNEGCKVQKVINVKSRSKRKNTFHLKISSKFIAGLRHARDRKKSMLLNKRQKTEHLLAQSSVLETEVASQDTDMLNQGRGDPMTKGEFSGGSTTAIKDSSYHKLTEEMSSPHIAETCVRLEAAPLYIREEAEGCRKADGSREQSDSHSSLPMREQSEAAVRVDEVCRGTSKAENTQMRMEEGDIHIGSWANSNLDSPRPEHSMGVVKADKVSRDTSQQSQHGCSEGEDNQQDRRPDPSLGCPLQELNVAAVAVDKTTEGACANNSVRLCIKKEKVTCQDCDRQEEIQVSTSSLEGKVPAPQNRVAACEVDQGQKILDKTCAKHTDLPAGECLDPLLKKKGSDVRREGSYEKLKVLSRD